MFTNSAHFVHALKFDIKIESRRTIASHLYQQMTKTVQWHRCLHYAKNDLVHDWHVIGPSRVLANLVKKEYPRDIIRYLLLPCYFYVRMIAQRCGRPIADLTDIRDHGPSLSSPFGPTGSKQR